MKVLLSYTDLRLGGIERFVLDLAQELGRLGHDVLLVTTWSRDFDAMEVLNKETPLFRRIDFGKRSGGRSLSIIWKMNWLIWKERPDVVHTNLFTLGYALPAALLHLPRRTKFVHTVHNQAEQEFPTPRVWLTRFLYLHRVTPVSISRKVLETMEERYPGVKSPLITNGCIVDTANEDELIHELKKLRCTEKTRLFLNVGHLSVSKNQRMLNRVARRLKKEGYDFAVAIVGRDDDKEYTAAFKAEQCASVHWLGPCKYAQSLLREADFFTLCSGYEGMPISIIEAIGNGCVPVCTPAGGIPDACINGVNGILAYENNEEGLYRSMKEALELSPEKYEEYRRASLELFKEKFSMEKCARKYEALYENRLQD